MPNSRRRKRGSSFSIAPLPQVSPTTPTVSLRINLEGYIAGKAAVEVQISETNPAACHEKRAVQEAAAEPAPQDGGVAEMASGGKHLLVETMLSETNRRERPRASQVSGAGGALEGDRKDLLPALPDSIAHMKLQCGPESDLHDDGAALAAEGHVRREVTHFIQTGSKEKGMPAQSPDKAVDVGMQNWLIMEQAQPPASPSSVLPTSSLDSAFSPQAVANTVGAGIDWSKGIFENGISAIVVTGTTLVGSIQRGMASPESGVADLSPSSKSAVGSKSTFAPLKIDGRLKMDDPASASSSPQASSSVGASGLLGFFEPKILQVRSPEKSEGGGTSPSPSVKDGGFGDGGSSDKGPEDDASSARLALVGDDDHFAFLSFGNRGKILPGGGHQHQLSDGRDREACESVASKSPMKTFASKAHVSTLPSTGSTSPSSRGSSSPSKASLSPSKASSSPSKSSTIDGGFPAPVDGGFPAPVDGGFLAPVDRGFQAPVDGGFPAPVDGGFPAPVDGGFPAPDGHCMIGLPAGMSRTRSSPVSTSVSELPGTGNQSPLSLSGRGFPVRELGVAGAARERQASSPTALREERTTVNLQKADENADGMYLTRTGEDVDEELPKLQREASWPGAVADLDRKMWREMEMKQFAAVRRWDQREAQRKSRMDGRWAPDDVVATKWQDGSVCMHPSVFPNARLFATQASLAISGSNGSAGSGGAAGGSCAVRPGGGKQSPRTAFRTGMVDRVSRTGSPSVSCTSLSHAENNDSSGSTEGGVMDYRLVTSLSKIVVERGPRALQQDSGMVEAVAGGVPFIVVCDGHGSVPMLLMDQGKTPQEVRSMVHVGGGQMADIGCNAIMDYVKSHASEFELAKADVFFHMAFVHAHRAVLEQLRMGSREGEGEAQLKASLLDGPYWKNATRLIVNLGAKRDNAVVRKVTKGEVTYYQRSTGKWEHADFGTTCTCCMILNAPDDEKPNRKVVVTAHAGDSDVCLLRFSHPQHSGQVPVLLWAKWLTKEHTMYNEEERERPTADGKKLGEREGTENLHHKVKVSITLPDGETGAIAYEPTRGLGHCEGQFSGIVPAPNVSCVEVRHNDIIIVGTDGLWNALGGRRKHGDTSPPKDEVSGPLMANLRNFAARYRHLDAQQLAFELTGLAKSRGLVDNTLFLVAKVSRIAPVAGASFKTSVHMRSTSPPIGGGILEFFTKPPF